MSKNSTICAGIDVSKAKLDVAVAGAKPAAYQVDNSPAGLVELARWLRHHKVTRVGLEATGGYERDAAEHLRKRRFEVVVLQPLQVRGFAQFSLRRAKNDRIDAALIAACAAQRTELRPPPDPRLAPWADLLTFIEQIEQDIARIKVRLEHVRDGHPRRLMGDDIKRLSRRRTAMLAKLEAALRKHEYYANRLDLIVSIDGVGQRTALTLLVRMPELGSLSREQAASLTGVAPFDDNSGKRDGQRHIAGGRARVRKSLFAAALPAAFKWNHRLKNLYRRLIADGKAHKLALIACVRKMVIFANTVLARGTPWQTTPEKT